MASQPLLSSRSGASINYQTEDGNGNGDVYSAAASSYHSGGAGDNKDTDSVSIDDAHPEEGQKKGLSTFFGVFVPCVLSIFSVILFLRLGFILGQAGLVGTLIMLTVAYFVVALTILSISAISTNGIIKGGGAYYMISRSLGPEFGGSIGTIFFFANVCASALYIAGFVESLIDNFGPSSSFDALPSGTWMVFAYSSAVLFLCLLVCLVGADAFAKASFIIFLVVMTSVITVFASFFVVGERDVDPPSSNTRTNHTLKYTGLSQHTLNENIDSDFTVDYTTNAKQTFQTIFGVLFNGCTGIMAGANMSGDLAKPSKSIPLGTLGSSAFTYVAYVALFILSAASSSRDLLINDYNYLQDTNIKGPLVTMGVFAATLSAALSTLIGASRILEALSRDQLFGSWMRIFLAKEGNSNPIAAVFMSWFLVQLVLFVGSINVIAPIVSMLFLLSYCIVNLACFVQRVQASPNFRPTFRYFTWHTALLGAVSCVAVMFFVEPMYAAASFLLMMLLFIYINFRSIPADWGEVSQALIYHQVRKYLLRLKDSTISVKYWRPQLLMLVTNPRKQYHEIAFANEIKKGGLFVLGHILARPFSQTAIRESRNTKQAWLHLASLEKWKAFVDVVVANSIRDGVRSLLASCGLGGMRPNILVLNFLRDSTSNDQLLAHISAAAEKASRKTWIRNYSAVDSEKYQQVTETFPPVMTLNGESREETMLESEYVGIIRDTLLMGKNVMMTRNFSQLEERMHGARGRRAARHIDLYPVVRSGPDRSLSFDFILQMATILHMVGRWRDLRIRVFVIVDPNTDLAAEKESLTAMLEDVRIIGADVQLLQYTPPPGLQQAGVTSFYDASMREQFSFVNQMIHTNSPETCVVFSFLPAPPDARATSLHTTSDENNDDDDSDLQSQTQSAAVTEYLDNIDILTRGTPPICLFHGVETVVTPNESAV